MKYYRIVIYVLLFIISLSGCTSYKKMLYLRDAETISAEEFASKPVVPIEARIMQNDLLTINVYTSDPESAIPYNLSVSSSSASNYSPVSQPLSPKYQVDSNGNINFPILGLIQVSGKTLHELEIYLQDELSKFVKEKPIVTVQFLENTFTIIGEVGSPGTFPIPNEKLNMLKAFSMAGDITDLTRLDNVKIFREDGNGKKEIIIINLNDKNLLFSTNFYVQRNDIIYVEAKKVKYYRSLIQEISTYTYGLTFLLSITTVVLNLKNNN